jgi:hypothetical protein
MIPKAQHPPQTAGAASGDLLGGKLRSLSSTPCIAQQIHGLGPQALSYLFADLARGQQRQRGSWTGPDDGPCDEIPF